jgi:hypothetical protein
LVGRVLLSHIGATVAHLASRDFLSMEMAGDGDPGWRLTVLDGKPEELLDYERALLHGLFGRQATIGLEHLTVWAVPVLEKIRAEIVRDAIDRGWLRPGLGRRFAVTRGQRRHHDQNPGKRTKPGGELLKDIKAFKRELRVLAGADDTPTLTRLAPYAMIFGLAAPIPTAGTAPEAPHEAADPRAWTTTFAASWLRACGADRNSGLAQWVWDPFQAHNPDYAPLHGHGHGGDTGHGGGHGGFHGEHGGGFAGGHGGGFTGGHGGGFTGGHG